MVVTGASGFIGKHLVEALERRGGLEVRCVSHNSTSAERNSALSDASIVFHLAGVNRPEHEDEFETGNTQFTRGICTTLRELQRRPLIVLTSSTQAALENPYGRSKRGAEQEVEALVSETGAKGVIYRLPNVFGKWCRPNYNSVVATLCHNTARGLPITISDPAREITFVYIDDVIESLLSLLDANLGAGHCCHGEVGTTYTVSLQDLADRITSFPDVRGGLVLPDFSDRLTHCLYATYLSYLPEDEFAYSLEQKTDNRGTLAEFLKSDSLGQIFVSRTRPGAVRGNHVHRTKTEKFFVVEGRGVVRFRHILTGEILEYPVSGQDFRVVDIPPGYAHSIQNVGDSELVVLFWASEIFDPMQPDTYPAEVPCS